jgi:peptidoglycan/xylan/chitin deacetylase (PgdA/CDA1 family)
MRRFGVAGLGVAAGSAALAYAVRSPRSSFFAPSVWHGARDRDSIALTFDDGPSESTPRLLDVLAEHHVRATFFQCGMHVRRCPSIARQVVAAGHEIGNHSDSHQALHFRSPSFIYRELYDAQRSIEDICGVTPGLFRAPFGLRWFGLAGVQERLALLGVMWSVIGLDWKRSAPQVADRVLQGSRAGAIICLHDGRGVQPRPDIAVTIEAVKRALPRWIDRGFKFETVSQILCKTN